MWRFALGALQTHARQALALLSAVCLGMLGYGLYLQHSLGLNPCPMCIVQRYALFSIASTAALTALTVSKPLRISGTLLILLETVFGAFVAARQSWLQWYPPEVATCGRDFYGMIEDFPIGRAIPMIFKGSGDCSAVDWTFLGGSIANWSFVSFCLIGLFAILLIKQNLRSR
ncbi:disulfide bond formation protein B [Rhodoferax sp.]|uniref:disulfide bond formation protein B n=1 Tax=Rhodoferax sp. TaxID=50421 RepID=UPI002634FE88|nr:disulfide bond formation protein B [Rhodoferax sp.]MDD5480212.1 disulfide bond formation protein B [Rhodoferax sp.]